MVFPSDGMVGSPPLAEIWFIPLNQEKCPHQIFIPETK